MTPAHVVDAARRAGIVRDPLTILLRKELGLV